MIVLEILDNIYILTLISKFEQSICEFKKLNLNFLTIASSGLLFSSKMVKRHKIFFSHWDPVI